MTLTISGQTFFAELAETEAAQSFASLLPRTLQMSELNGNEKYAYLKSEGFTYFCGVDLTTIPWVQLSTQAGYLRQGRVTVNGTQLINYPSRLAPFFDAEAVLDPARP